jgi:hypothetical protein
LLFIAPRVSNNTFYLQVFCGKWWQGLAKKLVQLSCKNLTCAKTVQIQCQP